MQRIANFVSKFQTLRSRN